MAAAADRSKRSAIWNGHKARDKALGTLIWQDGWEGDVVVPLLGRNKLHFSLYEELAELDKDTPPKAPAEWAGVYWTDFKKEWPRSRYDECVQTLHSFASDLAKTWIQQMNDDPFYDEALKEIAANAMSIRYFSRSLSPISVSMSRKGSKPYVSINFATSFDEEHGLALHFIKGRRGAVASSGGDGP